MSIYKIWYNDFVTTDRQNIGKRVKVFKGRKYPVGNEYTIKYFTVWRDTFGRIQTEYAVMESGEKININNLKLVVPNVGKEIIEKYIDSCDKDAKCPNCGCSKIVFKGVSFDPISDYYYKHFVCSKCDIDLKDIDY